MTEYAPAARPKLEVSVGEALDKWTIIKIKAGKITNPKKLENILAELEVLNDVCKPFLYSDSPAATMKIEELQRVNEELWDIEDEIRKLEGAGVPDIVSEYLPSDGGMISDKDIARALRFIELARAVYFTNDKRSEIKRELNVLLQSNIVEEKSYQSYRR